MENVCGAKGRAMQVATRSEPPYLGTLDAARNCGFRSPRGLLSAYRRGKILP
jgi:hypothetical protein